MIRKFRRNVIRKRVGNKGLCDAWESFQRNKYKHRYREICKKKGAK